NDDRSSDQHLRGTLQYLPSFIAVGIARDADQNDRDIVSFGHLYNLVDRCRRDDLETSRPRQALREKVTDKRTFLDNDGDWQLAARVAAAPRCEARCGLRCTNHIPGPPAESAQEKLPLEAIRWG